MDMENVSLDDIIDDIMDTIAELKKNKANKEEPENKATQALKCCPFCGSKAKLVNYSGIHYVRCQNCLASSDITDTEEKAVQLWNKRHVPYIDDMKDCAENIKLCSESLLDIVKLLK